MYTEHIKRFNHILYHHETSNKNRAYNIFTTLRSHILCYIHCVKYGKNNFIVHTSFLENLTCNKPLDLVFALDSSESIREANWSKLIRFTKAVVKTLDPTLTRVSVIRYNTNAEVPIPLGMYQYAQRFKVVHSNIDDMKRRMYGLLRVTFMNIKYSWLTVGNN